MKRCLLLMLAFAVAAAAQTSVVFLAGPISTKPGMTVVLDVRTSGAMPGPIAGLQWTIQFPPNNWVATVVPGVAANVAGKDVLVCSADNATCVLVGLNVATIGNGSVAQYTVTIPATAATGRVTIGVSGVMAAGPTGLEVPTTLGPAYVLIVLDRADLDANGVVDIADVRMMAQEAVGGSAACLHDQNGDSVCNLRDVFAVLLKALAR
jgi:hypothetical protein